ncbi:MAG TPA: T9SS type A sorting domain-containing protein [Flavobacteriales bacterium]|nr:T9SS type A sorting domain-containing protein [Flavobacteriales bacterium]
MTTRLLTPLLCLLFAQESGAQFTFNVVQEHPSVLSYNGACSVFEQQDGYVVFSVGWALDSTVGSTQITKYNSEGDIQWQKEHRREARSVYPGIIDPVAEISGSRYVAAMDEYGGPDPIVTYIYWWNSEGDTIRTRFFKSDSNVVNGNHGTRQLLALSDGGFLHCGWCANTPPGQGGCITRLDSTGSILWERVYPQTEYILNACEAPDGGFVLGGSRNAAQDEAVVIRTDSAGNVQWLRYHGLHAGTGAQRALINEQGNVLVPGSWKEDPLWSVYDKWACLFIYGSNGASQPRRDYYFHRNTYTAHVLEKGNGHYWLVGGTYQTGLDPDDVTLIWELDENLDSLWMRRYWFYDSDDAESYAYSVRSASDGGLVLCGSSRQGVLEPYPYKQDNWLIKLDSHGCLVPGCQNVGIDEVALGLSAYLSVSPNPVPTGQPLRISFEPPAGFTPTGPLRVMVLDAQGKQVHEELMSGTTLNLLNLQPSTGLYFLHLTDGARWLAGGKVVVE